MSSFVRHRLSLSGLFDQGHHAPRQPRPADSTEIKVKLEGFHLTCQLLVDRMPDGPGEGDAGTQPARQVHHPHGRAQVQHQVPDGGGEHTAHVLQVLY